MGTTGEYKLSMYQDYGPLGDKNHIHLVRDVRDGKVCIKKELSCVQEDIISFRKNYPNTYFPQVFDYFVLDNKLIVIEEYIEGVSLEEYMMGKALSEEAAIEIGKHICLALKFLHQAGPMIVYRDLNPQNVMVTKNGYVKLIDFDISRKFEEGKRKDTQLLGTANYAAPEQFGYHQTDNRTDIYAFGVILNFMLTGKVPVDLITTGKCQDVVQKCIELEPENRFQTIDEVFRILNNIQHTKKKYIPSDKSWTFPGFRTRTWWKMALAVIGYVAIVYGTIVICENSNSFVFWNDSIWLIFFQILSILINNNYHGITNKSSLWNNRKKSVRIITYIITWMMCMITAFFVSVMVEELAGIS